jgi:glucose-1-phosphate thymidylyltransferase
MSPVGVIPAAGYAARLQPLPCSKEVYPVGGRPVMDYLVERLLAANCRELRVVTRPEKRDVVEHARAVGAVVIEGSPGTLAESVSLGLRGLERSEVVLVGLPDTIWEPIDGFVSLLATRDEATEVVLGVFESDEPERSDVVALDPSGLVRSIHVKEAQPPGNLVWGCLAARVDALAGIERNGEPGRHLAALAASGVVRAVRFPGKMIDIGTPEALERAVAAARKRP